MKHLKSFLIFEWDIPGDLVGDPNLLVQNPRIPDTISLPKENNEWMKKPKRKRKKIYKK